MVVFVLKSKALYWDTSSAVPRNVCDTNAKENASQQLNIRSCKLLNREVKHHVYVLRQTRICTTWLSFLFPCRLLFIISTPKFVVSRNFSSIRIVWNCFNCSFSMLRNSQFNVYSVSIWGHRGNKLGTSRIEGRALTNCANTLAKDSVQRHVFQSTQDAFKWHYFLSPTLCLYSHEYLVTRVTLPFFYLCSSSWFSGFPCLLHSLYFVLSFRVLLDLDFVLRNKIGNQWIWFQEKTNQPLCNWEGGLKLLRRRRLRKRDFPNTKKRGREPTSFWWENKVAAVSLLRVLARKTSYQMLEILPFGDREKALPPSTEINVLTFVLKKQLVQ